MIEEIEDKRAEEEEKSEEEDSIADEDFDASNLFKLLLR
jgi:hypothetical protein